MQRTSHPQTKLAVVGVLAMAELFYVLIIALSGLAVPGWASTVGVMSFLFAILFVMVGIIGVYIARIHAMLQGRPEFIVTETVASPSAASKASAAAPARRRVSPPRLAQL